MQMALENGSVTTLTYEKGTFTIQGINDSSYIEKGKKIAEKCRLL
ncbi:MAG: histidine phosphatase family protein, partial [Enterococcus faecalis]|nr:histidine phosphatase family protein [Enterococcus faecalis]